MNVSMVFVFIYLELDINFGVELFFMREYILKIKWDFNCISFNYS